MVDSYKEFTKDDPRLESILPEKFHEYIKGVDEYTKETLGEMWNENIAKNAGKFFDKHGSLTDSFLGFGANKAVIAVGAGPSFNKNKELLKKVYDFNVQFKLDEQPFIIMCANHQFKPLLKMGVFPHFVLLNDGGDHIYDQLCTNIPKFGRKSILLCTIGANPNIVRDWEKQGGAICFFINKGTEQIETFKEHSDKDPERFMIPPGGNVLNAAFVLSLKILHSKVFMVLGNDLCFPIDTDIEKRRNLYYADGDYSSNLGSNRDEAKDRMSWMAYKHSPNIFAPDQNRVDFERVYTSRQLFVYKTWIEMHVGAWSELHKFNYINCTEGGILGVVSKEHKKKKFLEQNNWLMMDEMFPGRWITSTLALAVSKYLEFTRLCEKAAIHTGIKGGAASVIDLPGKTDTARLIVPPYIS